MTTAEDPLEREVGEVLRRWIPPLVHRLNSCLAVIHGALHVAGGPPGGPGEREFEEARFLLRQLALLARSPPPRSELLDLAPLVEGIAGLARPSFDYARVAIDLDRPGGSVPARSDPSRLGALLAVLVDWLLGAAAPAPSAGSGARVRLVLLVEEGCASLSGSLDDPRNRERPEPPLGAVPRARALGGTLAFHASERGQGFRLVLPILAQV